MSYRDATEWSNMRKHVVTARELDFDILLLRYPLILRVAHILRFAPEWCTLSLQSTSRNLPTASWSFNLDHTYSSEPHDFSGDMMSISIDAILFFLIRTKISSFDQGWIANFVLGNWKIFDVTQAAETSDWRMTIRLCKTRIGRRLLKCSDLLIVA